jgi:hypothetical protein
MNRGTLLTLLMACGTAQAAEWASLGNTDNGTFVIFVDVSSIRVAGQVRRAWVKFVFTPHTVRGVGDKWKTKAVYFDAYDCKEESSRVEATTTYFEDGTSRSVSPEELEKSWEPVTPDSVSRGEMDFVCSWKPK